MADQEILSSARVFSHPVDWYSFPARKSGSVQVMAFCVVMAYSDSQAAHVTGQPSSLYPASCEITKTGPTHILSGAS